jgi:hypothetical protein
MIKIKNYQNFVTHLSEARQLAAKDLYAKAIANYAQAFETGGSDGDWREEDSVFQKYVEFTHGGVENDYLAFLDKARGKQEKDDIFTKEYLKITLKRNDLGGAYKIAQEAKEQFPKTKRFAKAADSLKYAYTTTYQSYESIQLGFDGTYKVGNQDITNGGDVIAGGAYVSPLGEKKRVVVKKNIDEEGNLTQGDEEKCGSLTFIDQDGVDIARIENDIKAAGYFSQGLIAVEKDNGNYAYFDDFGQHIKEDFKNASTFTDSLAAVENQAGKWGIINREGKYKLQPEFDDIKLGAYEKYTNDGIYLAKTNDVYHIYNAQTNKKIGDFAANRVGEASYLIAYMDGNSGKWGFANNEGKTVIEPQYEEAKSFSGGLAPVKKDGKWGAISQDNKLRIPYKYNYLTGIESNKQVIFQDKEDGNYQILRFINA